MNLFKAFKKDEKGFTLIELIVVIAILAILAAIAIPRLAGFTDKAKEGNDKEYLNIVAHSVQTLVASGDATQTSGTDIVLTVSSAGVVTAITGLSSITDAPTLATFNAELVKLIPVQALKFYTVNKTVTIDGTSNIITIS